MFGSRCRIPCSATWFYSSFLVLHTCNIYSKYTNTKSLLQLGFMYSLLLLLIAGLGASGFTLFNNESRRSSPSNQILDVHDGSLMFHGGEYLYYGASYGQCREPDGNDGCKDASVSTCGFQTDHNVSLFRSFDLQTWTDGIPIFQMRNQPEPGVMFCPKIIFNPFSQLFVLWYNWLPASDGSFQTTYVGVATSLNVSGPFESHTLRLASLAEPNVGDFDLWIDEADNFTAYVIYTSQLIPKNRLHMVLLVFICIWSVALILTCQACFGIPLVLFIVLFFVIKSPTHFVSIERLSPDYLSSLGSAASSGFIGSGGTEAPTMFRRNGTYYALLGQTCCFCAEGGPVTYYTSRNPLGPYVKRERISSLPAQQTQVSKLPGDVLLWRGNRWQSAPDRIKAHDFTYFHVLQFSADAIVPFQWSDVVSWNNSAD